VSATARERLATRWPTTAVTEHDVFHHYEDEDLGFGPMFRNAGFAVELAPFRFELAVRWTAGQPATTLRAAAPSLDSDARWALFADRATRDALARFRFSTDYEIAPNFAVDADQIAEAFVGFASVPLRIVRDHEIASATWPPWHVWRAIAAERFDVLGDMKTPGRWLAAIDNDGSMVTVYTDEDLALIRAWRA
jgi:hypothetical protein